MSSFWTYPSPQWEGPLVNGVERCQVLKKKIARRLPVLPASAHTMSGERERFLQASGAYGYLEKPAYVSAVLAERARQLTE